MFASFYLILIINNSILQTMDQNLISGEMTAEAIQACNDAPKVLKDKMPFLSKMHNVDVSS